MKTLQNLLVSTVLATGLIAVGAIQAKGQPLVLGSKLDTDLSVQGQSGGSIDSKGCGFIAPAPNQVINVTNRIDYMRLSVQANGGEPTLLVDGPGGRFCMLADEVSGKNPEISGVWLPGSYSVYVGDRQGASHQYTLNISQQN